MKDDLDETRIYTIWPAKEGLPAATSRPWPQEPCWLVLDVTDGLDTAYIVEGPVTRQMALQRAAEMQVVAKTKHVTTVDTPAGKDAI